jgi:CubicO group peptidase (beta-lactamase class C family)
MFQSIYIAGVLGIPSPPGQRDIARYVAGRDLDFTPGDKEVYSNFGYMLLGLIVKEATGQTYTSYIQDDIFAPLGVRPSEIALGRTLPADRDPREPWYASPYLGPSVFPPYSPVPWPDGGWYLEAMESHGGLIATIRSLLAFAQAYWYDGAPRSGNGQDWVSFGSLDGTFAILRWRPDGVNMAAIFNNRDCTACPAHEEIWPLFDAVADGIAEWPTTTPGAHKVYLPTVLRQSAGSAGR